MVVLAYAKHGVETYDSAVALLRERLEEGYWYDATETALAEEAMERESAAWEFLESRSDYEYERVEKQVPKT